MNRVAEGNRMADAQNKELLRTQALQWVCNTPHGRTMNRHIEVIWANFGDVFNSRDEFDIAVNAKLARRKNAGTFS